MDIAGKVIAITGGTSGLGQAAAIDFAKAGGRVIVIGRDATRAEDTRRQAGGNIEIVLGDVATRGGVAAVARALLDKAPRLDVLVNNAGGTFKTPSQTADGLETTFALNTFGPYVLEKAVHGALVAAKGRVVNVVTGFLGQYPVPEIDELLSPAKYGGTKQYARTKHASLMATIEQAHRYAPEGVTAVALHPGIIMGTRFGGGQPKAVQAIAGPIMRAFGIACTLDEAVRRFRVACFGDVPSGSYVVKGAPAKLPKQAEDAAIRAKVIDKLEQLAAA